MPSDNNGTNRRSVLKTTGLALAGITGMSGAASASPGNGRGRPDHAGERGRPDHAGEQGPPAHAAMSWLEVKNGQLELTADPTDWNSGQDLRTRPDVPDEARPIPYSAIQEALEEINEGIENGVLDVRTEDDIETIVPGDEAPSSWGDA